MRKMKKVFAVLLSMTMIASTGITSFAAQSNVPVSVPKTYKVNHGTAPSQTFEYSFKPLKYVNGDGDLYIYDDGQEQYVGPNGPSSDNPVRAVSIPNTTIQFDATGKTTDKTSDDLNINAADFAIGVHTYRVTEIIPKKQTAGITYSTEPIYLVITVLRDEDNSKNYVAHLHYQTADSTNKTQGFTNVYNSGTLKVEKKITGNMADINKKFNFTVTFSADDTEVLDTSSSTITTGNENATRTVSDGKIVYKVELGNGESIEFDNIPAGAKYNVVEDKENYTLSDVRFTNGETTDSAITVTENGVTTLTGAEGTMKEATADTDGAVDDDEVAFTNTLDNTVDTGIILDSAPYVLLLALAGLGAFAVVSKKREEEF